MFDNVCYVQETHRVMKSLRDYRIQNNIKPMGRLYEDFMYAITFIILVGAYLVGTLIAIRNEIRDRFRE